MGDQTTLAQAVQAQGDELYQAALLLAYTPAKAEALLLRAAKALLAAPPASFDFISLVGALLAAAPAASHKLLPGAKPTSTIEQIAQLPAEQRLALDLCIRHDYTLDQVSSLFGGYERARQVLWDAMFTLATSSEPGTPATLFSGSEAGETCIATRQALALEPGAVFDRGVRAHLATCSGCRQAEQAWGRVRRAIDQALRNELRQQHMPATTSTRLANLFAPRQALVSSRWFTPQVLRVALPVAVLMLVALLVIPRPTQRPGASVPSSDPADPRALLQEAQINLYQPSITSGTWHGKYEMRWNFSSSLYATLIGDIWRSQSPIRFRMQLTHADGGAPYEFLVANGSAAWYAGGEIYSQSVYGLLAPQVRVSMPQDAQGVLYETHTTQGAWGLPGEYLRQGLAAGELSTWGRQRAQDGSEQLVIGFQGISPLGLPEGTPNAPSNATTMLLTVDIAKGQLREIREVSGPAGGEQVSRTVWRQISDTQATPEETSTLFNAERSYTGIGTFTDTPGTLADPALPMFDTAALDVPLPSPTEEQLLPGVMPVGIDRIWTLAAVAGRERSVFYLGPAQRMLITSHQRTGDPRTSIDSSSGDPSSEMVAQGVIRARITPLPGQHYTALVENSEQPQLSASVSTFGIRREELLGVIYSLSLFDQDMYLAQADLFRAPAISEPAAQWALLTALRPAQLTPGQVQHTITTVSMRQGPLRDPLGDPYHKPLYAAGVPPFTSERWLRTTDAGPEYATITRDVNGELSSQTVRQPNRFSNYSRAFNVLNTYINYQLPSESLLDELGSALLRMQACGGATSEQQANGSLVITLAEKDWQNDSCVTQYSSLLAAQQANLGQLQENTGWNQSPEPDEGPFLADVADQTLYHRVVVNAAGQTGRYELWAGEPESGVLLSSIERTTNQILSAEQVPANAFRPAEPPALITFTSGQAGAVVMFQDTTANLGIDQAEDVVNTPIWYFPPESGRTLSAVAGVPRRSSQMWQFMQTFETALNNGFAVRLSYTSPGDGNQSMQDIYIGPASTFGAVLRTRSNWLSSRQIETAIAGETRSVWEVVDTTQRTWLLFELDGSLIAAETGSAMRQASLNDLARYEREQAQ